MTTPTLLPEASPTSNEHHPAPVQAGIFSPRSLIAAFPQALSKLDPRLMIRTPVMFVVLVGSVLTTVLALMDPSLFSIAVAIWLWLTVIFANLAEAVAEGRGRAQAASLRATRTDTPARKLHDDGTVEEVPATSLKLNDRVVCEGGDVIPSDGDVVEGAAAVDESAITGESAPVIRESGGDRSAVTGGTRVLSDRIVVRITAEPGKTFLDRMISLVEGSARSKTPNEIALGILLSVLTIIFLLAVVTLAPMANYVGSPQSIIVLISLLVCLIPTTIGALLSAIGVAGMDRLVQRNVLAMSGRAVEAAGDVSTLLMDKTGTITFGNRYATDLIPAPGVAVGELAGVAHLASMADETPEGRSIVELCEREYGVGLDSARPTTGGLDSARPTTQGLDSARPTTEGLDSTRPTTDSARPTTETEWVQFTALTRMSGVNVKGQQIRKGAAAAVKAWVTNAGGTYPESVDADVDRVAQAGGTPLLVAVDGRVLGVIQLTDVVKPGIRERFAELREMGIRSVMVTGDGPLTAKAIGAEAGVDEVISEATPEDKLAYIKAEQASGRIVAMTGDGTNDAPALAQADVGVAMNSGTAAAKEAGNMVDLDSTPTKLLEIVKIGKQLLITRGALTTFSIANDIAKYFAILPAMFAAAIPGLDKLNIMQLHSPTSAVLSAVIFNALIITALIPLALRGVRYRPSSASALLRRNLLLYGVGGLVAPFVGIKIIDLLISLLPGM